MLASLAAVFVAGLLVGFTGFGFNLLAVPLLALTMPTKEAVVIALLVGAVITAVLAALNHQHLQMRVLAALCVGSLPGLLAGAFLFTEASEAYLRVGVGVLCLVFTVVLLRQRSRRSPQPRRAAPASSETSLAGTVSGVLAATTGMGGPPVIIYLMAKFDAAHQVRATIVLYTAVVSCLAVGGLASVGQVGVAELANSGMLAPAGLAGAGLSSVLFGRIPRLHTPAVAVTLVLVAASGISLALVPR